MDIQELGAIGEFVAAIATVCTLGYLAVQIRLSSRTSIAEAERQTLTGLHVQHALLWGDADSTRIMLTGLTQGLGELSDEEIMMFSARMSELANQYSIARRMGERKVIDDDMCRQVCGGINVILNSRGGREWWHKAAHAVWPDLSEEIGAFDGACFEDYLASLRGSEQAANAS